MPERKRDGLAYDGGVIRIGTPGALERLLRFSGQDLSGRMIDFSSNRWDRCRAPERARIGRFLEDAVRQVADACILPAPSESLPPVCTEVEEVMVGGKPGPPKKWAPGVVKGYSWDSVFFLWRVEVAFPPRVAGYYYGNPIRGSSTFVHTLHVVGSEERPFSTMTPDELEELAEQRRQAFWRTIDPRSGLCDPSGIVPPSGRSSLAETPSPVIPVSLRRH